MPCFMRDGKPWEILIGGFKEAISGLRLLSPVLPSSYLWASTTWLASAQPLITSGYGAVDINQNYEEGSSELGDVELSLGLK